MSSCTESGSSRSDDSERGSTPFIPVKIPSCGPQAAIDSFWRTFTSSYPGKVHQILPKNPYAASKSASEPKGTVSGNPTHKSYEEAKAECEAAVKKIAQECERCNLRYRDPHFDIEWDLKLTYGADCLFGLRLPGNFNTRDKPRSVKRVPDIFVKPEFYIDGPTPFDIRQGLGSDCWFLAALGCLGSKEGLIQRICVAREEKVGVYGFVFYRDGEWIPTVIDDKLYLRMSDWDESKDEKTQWQRVLLRDDSEDEYTQAFQKGSRALYFAGCTERAETWLPLLEKAYAKAHGDYNSIDNGYVGEAIEDLTGGVVTELLTTDILDRDKFWEEELSEVNKKFLFGCSTGKFDNWQGGGDLTDRKGIQSKHAYSIMEAREAKGIRLLKLRNPWGQTEWTGPWSDGSKEWTAEWMEILGHTFANDGMFWISYEDWQKKYHFLDRTRLFDESWSITQQWTSLQVHWSADYHSTKFTFTTKEEGPVVVVLSQLDDRYWKDFRGQYAFSLHFRINKANEDDYLYRSHGNYRMQRSVSTEIQNLPPGTYDVRMKVTASRYHNQPTVDQVVKDAVHTRQNKLLQVAMSYDMAHAKGTIIETEEEKQRRAEEKIRADSAANERIRLDEIAMIERAKALKRKEYDLEVKKIMRRKKLEDDKIRHQQRKAAQNRAHNRDLGQQQNGAVVQTTTQTDFGSEEALGQVNLQHTPLEHNPISPTYQARAPPSVADTIMTFDSSVDPDLDPQYFPSRNTTIQNLEAPPDYPNNQMDPNQQDFAADAWNAVCVVGLRVYTQNGPATVKVVQPREGQTTATDHGIVVNGAPTNLSNEQTIPIPTQLDVDDQMRGPAAANDRASMQQQQHGSRESDLQQHSTAADSSREGGSGGRRTKDKRRKSGRGRGRGQG